MAHYDIGMVRVFVLVYETGSVTATAEHLFLSQPSVSYTLRKLRHLFNDQLFRRRGHALDPTPVAEDLYPKLKRLLESLDEVMEGAADFHPASSSRRFRLRMTDVGMSGLLPTIVRLVREHAPGVVLEVETLNLATATHDLRTGQADAVVCTALLEGADIRRDLLFEQAYAGLRAADHPRISDSPTLADYEAEEHVGVTPSSGHTALEQRAQELGISRRVALVVPNFSALPGLLQGTELVSYAPSSAADRLAGRSALRTFRLPFEVPVTQVALYTLQRELPSPDLDWLRTTLIDSLQVGRASAPLR